MSQGKLLCSYMQKPAMPSLVSSQNRSHEQS